MAGKPKAADQVKTERGLLTRAISSAKSDRQRVQLLQLALGQIEQRRMGLKAEAVRLSNQKKWVSAQIISITHGDLFP